MCAVVNLWEFLNNTNYQPAYFLLSLKESCGLLLLALATGAEAEQISPLSL